tara:strand:- start:970 stop:3900 length:2931 start_codon:yes stop_codon:yes gene_type:complete
LTQFSLGQRWISNAEPELGMGQVFAIASRQVTVHFPISGTNRTYSEQRAPLTRVRFSPGDEIESDEGWILQVTSVTDVDDLIVYHGIAEGEERILIETRLQEEIRFNKPQERLFSHQIDANEWFDIRYQTLTHHARLVQSSCRGLCGPRVALIPHQLYIGNEVAGRFSPRVLLADEVGLGKTIEAGLIVHQQLHTGRANRVLIIVPKALTFQWFVEMIRRFNLQLAVLDEERCQQIQQDNMEADEIEQSESQESTPGPDAYSFNPFHAQQLVLCSMDLFSDNPHRTQQAAEGDWDLLVVDEAHHLAWSPGSVSREYRVVEQLAEAVKGVLLLTATPEQLGKTGHFARLRLLDPDRFYSLDAFLEDENRYQSIAGLIDELIDIPDVDIAAKIDDVVEQTGIALRRTDSGAELIQQLLDRHGTGRILFRNSRATVSGFSPRILAAVPLPFPKAYEQCLQSESLLELLCPERQYSDRGIGKWIEADPRVPWLVALLGTLNSQKVLIICANAATAVDLEDHLKRRQGISSAVFHEGMDLIGRDRAAAYFADPDRGAQVLICSEIGSEGRNFQFSQHLVLFDLPPNPDLVEQRIGRLDRIGQRHVVTIHVPYLSDSVHELLFRYYHEGLNLFVEPNPAAQNLFPDTQPQLETLIYSCARAGSLPPQLGQFIKDTARLNLDRKEMLAGGRDRLLELNSNRSEVSARLIDEILTNEGGATLQHYMSQVCDLHGLESDPLDLNVDLLKPTERMQRHVAVSLETQQRFRFPELPEDGVRITFDRATALAREDVLFMSWESPMVIQAMDLVMTDILGNCCAIVIKHPSFPTGTVLVEALYQVETVAPAELQVHRYLPAALVRCLMDADGHNIASQHEYQSFCGQELSIDPNDLFRIIESQAAGLKTMISQAAESANAVLKQVIDVAMREMAQDLETELHRLTELRKVNANVRTEEIDFLQSTRQRMTQAIHKAALRHDAIRVIIVA